MFKILMHFRAEILVSLSSAELLFLRCDFEIKIIDSEETDKPSTWENKNLNPQPGKTRIQGRVQHILISHTPTNPPFENYERKPGL